MNSIPTLTDLKARLDEENLAGKLTLTAENIAAGKLAQFLRALPEQHINLSDAIITLDSIDKLTIEGDCGEDWVILGLGDKSLRIGRVVVVYTKGDDLLETELSFEGNIQIGQSFIEVIGALNGNNELDCRLTEKPGATLSLAGIAGFISNNRLANYLPLNVDLFGVVPLTAMDFSFGYTRAVHTRFSFMSDIDAEWRIIDNFASLKNIGVTLNTRFYYGDDGFYRESMGGDIHATLHIEQDFRARLALKDGNLWKIELSPADGNILPGLSALAGLMGGDTLKNDIQHGLENLGLDSVSLDGVCIGFDIVEKRLFNITVRGHITVDGIVFNIQITLPKFAFHGSLSPNSSISLKTLVATYFSGANAFPDVAITGLIISAQPERSRYEFFASIASDWEMQVGAVPIGISKFDFDIVKEPTGITGFIHGIFVIGEAEFDVIADHPLAGGGWQFDGSTGPGQRLPIGTLVESLASLFGDDVKEMLPAAIANLIVDNLHVSFNTESKDFTYFYECEFPIDGDAKVAMTVTIAITNRNDSYEKEFGAHIEVNVANLPAPLIFDVKFLDEKTEGKTSDLFIATYNHAGGEQKLNLGDLVRSLAQDDPAPEWTRALDGIAIDLKDAMFAFSKTGEEKKFLFGLDIGADISLSNLPLVGKEFPPDRTVGITDLQVLVASKPFSAEEVKKLNGLIPAGVTKLPEVSQTAGAQNGSQDDANTIALKQGLNVGATLKLGDLTRSLSLPVVAGGSPQTTAPPASTSTTTSTTQAVATTDNAAWLKIQKSLGPVHFERVGVQYKDATLWFLLDAALTAAGLTLSLDGLSIGSPISKFEPRFDLRGLGIDYRNDALEIGGAFLKIADKEYAGAALIKAKQLTLSALGMYKEMDDGHPSVFVYAVMDYPIGGPSFFYVTGLAAGFGYSRALKIPTIDKVASFSLVENARKGAGMPQDIGEELRKMANDITPAAGENFLAIGVKFTSFKIVESFALLTISFGSHFEINLLGLSSLVAPANAGPNVPPVAEAQLALKASFQPDKGFLGVQAQLTPNSYILSKDCHLTGGFAFYSWFEGSEHNGDFVMTLGGYHPNFKVPAHYPTVPRLGFNWQVSHALSIKGDAYFALTASALMAGGHLEANWQSGSVRAWFKLGADFLIAWKPYHYEISAYVAIGAEVTFEFFGTQHISVDVGADLRIWGPEFSGEATIHLWIISFTVSFGAGASQTPQPIGWTEFKSSFLPAEKDVCSITVTGGMIGKDPQDTTDLGVINPKEFSLATNSVVPSTTAQYALEDKTQAISLGQAPGRFGIGSMAITAADLTSTQTITIKREGNFAGEDFEYTPIFKKVPAGLWGESLTPEVNGKQFVEDALSGFEIRPKTKSKPGETAAIERRKLQESGFSGEGEYRWENVKTFAAARFESEQKRREEFRKSLAASAAGRNAILAALGFTPDDLGKIALSAAQADDFLIAPQIEQS